MRMNATTHYAIARHGGTLTTRPLQAAIDVADHREVVGGNGVYIACDRDDGVIYVGSVYRPHSMCGIADRIGEHLRDSCKLLSWRRLWVVEITADATEKQVRTIEAMIGAELVPAGNHRLPRLLPV